MMKMQTSIKAKAKARADLPGGRMSALEVEEMDEREKARRIACRLELERRDLEERISATRAEFSKLARRRLVYEDELKKLVLEETRLKEDQKCFDHARKSSWFQNTLLPTSDMRRVKMNVGGYVFETYARVLSRDPGSLLAALVEEKVDMDACVFIERDWWLFRHILCFLRDGRLPRNHELLTQLYREADYYKLETMRVAIRDFLDPNHVVERSASMPLSKLFAGGDVKRRESLEEYFEEATKRYIKNSENSSKRKNTATEGKTVGDWWTSSKYKGRDYSFVKSSTSDFKWRALDGKPEKPSSKHKSERALTTTWATHDDDDDE